MSIRPVTCPARGMPGTHPRAAPSRAPSQVRQTRATLPSTPSRRTTTSRLGTKRLPACCLRSACAVGALFLLPSRPFLDPFRMTLESTTEKRRTGGMIPPLTRRMEQRKVDGAIILPTSRHPRSDGFDDSTRMDLCSRPSFCLSLGLFGRSSMDGVHWTLTGRDAILEGLLSHLGSRCVSFVFFLFNNLDTAVSSPCSPIDLVPGSSMDSTGQGPVFFFVDFKQVLAGSGSRGSYR